jgi:hypothetical protein
VTNNAGKPFLLRLARIAKLQQDNAELKSSNEFQARHLAETIQNFRPNVYGPLDSELTWAYTNDIIRAVRPLVRRAKANRRALSSIPARAHKMVNPAWQEIDQVAPTVSTLNAALKFRKHIKATFPRRISKP